MDFSQLPYFDKNRGIDINPDRPYMTASIILPPFQNDGLILRSGVHLHWSMPKMLSTTRYVWKKQKPDEESNPTRDQQTQREREESTDFPVVPNRWYIKREQGERVEEWIVESDYLWQERPNCPLDGLSKVALNVDIYSGEKPYTFMGRKWSLEDWKKRGQETGKYWKEEWGKGLTALGWGSPVFDVFYPNCMSVFGMHDPEYPSIRELPPLTYTVVGWYMDSSQKTTKGNDDYCMEVIDACRKKMKSDSKIGGEQPSDEELLALFTEAFQINVPEGSKLPKDGMVCYGKVRILDQIKTFGNPEEIKFTASNSPSGAISALIASSIKLPQWDDYNKVQHKIMAEEYLEAVLLDDQLKGQTLDIGTKLRELRHEKGFLAIDSGTRWAVQEEDLESNKTVPEDKQKLPSLPKEIHALLRLLNEAEWKYSLAKNELESQMTALYADWSRYMLCCYPPDGETFEYPDPNIALDFIKNNPLAGVKRLKKLLGSRNLSEQQTTKPNTTLGESLSGIIWGASQKLIAAIEKENKKLKDKKFKKKWALQPTGGTRYWEPTAPTIVISCPKGKVPNLRATERFGQGEQQVNGLTCKLFDGEVSFDQNKKFNIQNLLNAFQNEVLAGGYNEVTGETWDSFRIEWKVDFFPTATGNAQTRKNNNFSEDFIRLNYSLAEGDADLTANPSLTSGQSLLKGANIYQGTSFISRNLREDYLKAIEAFRSNKKVEAGSFGGKTLKSAQAILLDSDIIAFSLEGINLALLQQKQLVKLKPADPLGFNEYRKFSEEIGKEIDSGIGNSPNPFSNFNPIRAGALRLDKVRLVDTFGRIHDMVPQNLTPSTGLTMDGQKQWINLRPRLCQPAAMSVRWVDSKTSGAAPGAKDIYSPISGWLVADSNKNILYFYDALGKHIGNITQNSPTKGGRWEIDIFTSIMPDSAIGPKANNEMLNRVIDWLLAESQKSESFLDKFIRSCASAMDNIVPEGNQSKSILSLLSGRPIAILQSKLNFYVKGRPAFDLKWNEFGKDFSRCFRESNGFTKVKFPYRLGSFQKLNDGLVGYWKQTESGELEKNFWVSESMTGSLGNFDESKLSWLDFESDMRLPETKDLNLKDLLVQLAGDGTIIKKQDFVRQYFLNGNKYWDNLVGAGWIVLNQVNESSIRQSAFNTLSCAIEEKPQTFTILFNPFGSLHIVTGILPVKSLEFPEEFYKDALRAMELNFLCAPLISPKTKLSLSLHEEKEYHWSWLQAHKENGKRFFTRTWEMPSIRKATFVSAWTAKYSTEASLPGAEEIWLALPQKGWGILDTDEQGEFALLQRDNLDSEGEKEESDKPIFEAFSAILPDITEEIISFSDRARFSGPLEITEGWLSLKQNKPNAI